MFLRARWRSGLRLEQVRLDDYRMAAGRGLWVRLFFANSLACAIRDIY